MSLVKYVLVLVSFVLFYSSAAEINDASWSILSSFMSKVYSDCGRKDYDISDCLKVKFVSLLDRMVRSDVIELDESIKLVKEDNRIDHGRALTENDVENTLTSEDEKGPKLNDMIFDRISKFLTSHSLKINFPKVNMTSFTRSLSEGRGKMKKTMGMFMMAAMMKAMMMIPMSLGTLFILAGKALIISKIALVLSLIILLKKLLSKPTEHVLHESHGWNAGAGAGGWDKRSYKPVDSTLSQQNTHAQNLAYNSYINH